MGILGKLNKAFFFIFCHIFDIFHAFLKGFAVLFPSLLRSTLKNWPKKKKSLVQLTFLLISLIMCTSKTRKIQVFRVIPGTRSIITKESKQSIFLANICLRDHLYHQRSVIFDVTTTFDYIYEQKFFRPLFSFF